jgi:hypothetical protein
VAKNVEGFILGSPIGGMMNPEVLTKKRGI